MSDLDLSAAVEAHHPVKGGSSMSNIPGGYTGDWVICSCDPGDAWNRMAERIPIADYPVHLLAAAAPLIEAQVRAQVAAEIEDLAVAMRNSDGWDEEWSTREVRDALGKAAGIARGESA